MICHNTPLQVDRVLDTLNLHKVKDSLIGNALRRGVSGGEKKRVNIGNELLTDPSALSSCFRVHAHVGSIDLLLVSVLRMYLFLPFASSQVSCCWTSPRRDSTVLQRTDWFAS